MRPFRFCLFALLIGLVAADGHSQQPQTPPVEKPPVIAPAVVPSTDDIPAVDPLKTPLAVNVAIRGAVQGDLVVIAPVGQLLELSLTGNGAAESGPVFWTYSEAIPDKSERDAGHWVGLTFPPDVAGKAYLVQAAVNGPEGKPPLVALRWLVVAGVAPQPPPDKPVDPAPTPVKPTPVEPKPTTVTAVTYVYEKDNGGVPSGVRVALDKLNRQGILATEFEDDTTDGDDDVPLQYQIALNAARAKSLPGELKPSLVVMRGTVPEVWHDVRTEQDVMEAAK